MRWATVGWASALAKNVGKDEHAARAEAAGERANADRLALQVQQLQDELGRCAFAFALQPNPSRGLLAAAVPSVTASAPCLVESPTSCLPTGSKAWHGNPRSAGRGGSALAVCVQYLCVCLRRMRASVRVQQREARVRADVGKTSTQRGCACSRRCDSRSALTL